MEKIQNYFILGALDFYMSQKEDEEQKRRRGIKVSLSMLLDMRNSL
jgi:hypothetical protein